MSKTSRLQSDVEQVALLLATANAALDSARYNQVKALLHEALERITFVNRELADLERGTADGPFGSAWPHNGRELSPRR